MYDQLIRLKYLGIFILMMVFPSESVMPLAGHMSAKGGWSLIGTIIVGTAGSTTVSTLIYLLAKLIKPDTLTRLITKYGRWIGITLNTTERAGRWFDIHARAAVFFGRFVPGLRSAVSVPAGSRRMPILPFVFYTLAGSGLWISLLAWLGYIAEDQYNRFQSITSHTATIIGASVFGLILIVVMVGSVHQLRSKT